ncbi:MAG TPA: hypothetical protein VFL99_16720 [Segeticoccus sp.]|uniref:hypothetical protein n=1 Tax=Segeticoccus sp. TaxID=2706531 RepID=UPI002D7ECFA0|nr:hypothetical protein [Segeticoccus sp.]HET8601970.1 hypothetical protein [Segeticoccus sp.]
MRTGRLLRSLGGVALLVALVVGTFWLGPAMDRSLPSAAPSAARATPAAEAVGPTIVVGTGAGLTWSDVGPRATPHLWSLLAHGGSGALVVRSVHATTCPLDGWLGLSAGVRASATPGGAGVVPGCVPVPQPRTSASGAGNASGTPVGGATVPGWSPWRALARHRLMDARPGLLADTLQAHGRCVQAIGPGAAVAAADSRGHVARYAPWTSSGTLPLRRCPVTVVDVGSPRRGDGAPDLRAVDRRVGRVLAQAPPDADVIVAALSDRGQRSRLRLLAVRAANPATGGATGGRAGGAVLGAAPPTRAGHGRTGGGLLWSGSTRQLGLVQSADVTATVLARAGIALPDGVAGAPLRLAPHADLGTSPPISGDSARKVPRSAGDSLDRHGRLDTLRGLGRAAALVSPLVPPFFVGVVLLQLLGYGSAWWCWRRAMPRGTAAAPRNLAATTATRRRVAGLVRVGATAAAGIPVATYLAQALPWWDAPRPAAALIAAVAAFVLSLAVAAFAGFGWHRTGPVTAVVVSTVVVLGVDALTGSRLVLSSLLGVQPLVGGRFYGIGNVAFAVLATSALLAAALLAAPWTARGRRVTAVVLTLIVGLAAVAVDGSPWWGSDLGGVAALLPAVLVLAAGASGLRWTPARTVGAGAVTVLALAAVLVADWLRPPAARTHLGRFVEALAHGHAGDIVLRKLEQNLAVLLTAPLALLVPAGLAVAVWVLARPGSRAGRPLARLARRVPLLRPALWAVAVCLVLGFAANDTGAAIPPVSTLVLLPTLVALAAGTATLSEGATAREPGADPAGVGGAESAAREPDHTGAGRALLSADDAPAAKRAAT